MRAILTTTLIAGLLGLAASRGPAQAPPPPPPPPADALPEGVAVQARGQVHEAYGEPTQLQPLPGVLVPKPPPDPIEEVPPAEKPAGDNVGWVPGYWTWDGEDKDFVWVSGFWRVLPPGQTWVPGHWAKVADGFRFASGYWAPNVAATENHELVYLPQPPAPVETGPSVPAPNLTDTYVPGCWVYQVNRYLWRPGYWLAYQPNWVWVPARYRWSPAGFIFVNGYWDRPMLTRGLLFAPVRFTRPIYRQVGYVYRPSFVIQPDFLMGAMFVSVNRPAYYFGDYFTNAYQKRFVPWDVFRPNRFTIDANFGYYRHTYAGNPVWAQNLRVFYAGRYNGDVPRPPRTLIQQTVVVNRIVGNRTAGVVVNKTINVTNLQSMTVLAPVRSVKNVRVTALASLAGPRGRPLPAAYEMRVDHATKAHLVQEQRAITRTREISRQRVVTETKLVTRPPATVVAPHRTRIELPKGTPPPRVVVPLKGVPVAPRGEIHHPPKGREPIRPK